MIKRSKTAVVFTLILLISICLSVFAGQNAHVKKESLILNVSLYRNLPDYDTFEKTVEDCWKKKHPGLELNFVDWNCYSGTVPDDLDVFVFDIISLDTFIKKGYLLDLSEKDIEDYDDLIPSFMQGCRQNGVIYAIPQILCTELLYTRKDDEELQNVSNISELYDVLGNSGLLLDKESSASKVIMYLQALTDETQCYIDHYPPIEDGVLSQHAIAFLRMISEMRQTEDRDVSENYSMYSYARIFAQGMGRAYIGYSEAMDLMDKKVSEMDFRLFSMSDDDNIPVFYVDAAAINAKISDEKRTLALDFLNMITGRDLMTKASENGGDSRYLLAARYSVYDALASDYPIYEELKKIALVADAYVFRIQPDGNAYLEEAVNNADLLPSLSKREEDH